MSRQLAEQIARPVVRLVPRAALLARRLLRDEAAQLPAQHGYMLRFGQRVLDHHSPVRFGGRFSMKAATASRRSASVLERSS